MLTKYHPFNDFGDLAKSMALFDEPFARFFGEGSTARPWTPPVDIHETDQELVLKADVPDVKAEDIEVNFENGTLTLRGKREFEKKEEGKGYHRIERNYGSFVRAFSLPETIDPEKLTAGYKDGVLTIAIGKKEVAKPRTVKVNVAAV
jgi:HSP20 family protein